MTRRQQTLPGDASTPHRASTTSPITGRVAGCAALLAVIALAAGVTTPVRSGPNCTQAVCLRYPYPDAAQGVPRDYWWMYPATLLALTVLALLACLYRDATGTRRTLGLIGFGLAGVAATALGIDYTIQLAVVQPSLLAGQHDGLAPLVMYNPHGLFIALEDLGYLLTGAVLVFAGLAITDRSRAGRGARWVLATAGAAVLVAFAVLLIRERADLADQVEIIAISIEWLAIAAAGVLLLITSRRRPTPGATTARPSGQHGQNGQNRHHEPAQDRSHPATQDAP